MGAPALTAKVEAYLEAIFELDEIGERITQARLARWFGVSPPATLEVVRRMERMGLIGFAGDRSVVLTPDGLTHARVMAARHRVIERFLVDILGVPWHRADEEGRRMEPGVTPEIEERMRRVLGDPDRCPHGNPIPGSKAAVPIALTPLDACGPERPWRIDRIREDLELDLDMLRYLEDHKLLPGTELEVTGRRPDGGVTVRSGGADVELEPALASHVLCVAA